jgi:hypothetical protein
MTVCIETTKNVTARYSEKFVKEINKFFDWVKSNGYTIRDIENDITKEWNIELLNKFEEPGRNKIESYLKELTNIYVIIHEDKEVEDVKMIAKDFKLEKKDKKQEKKQKIENKKKQETPNMNITVVNEYDSKDMKYLDTLKVKWSVLQEKFGEPIKTEKFHNPDDSESDCKYRCEWKIKISTTIGSEVLYNYYSIYDWVNKKGKFDNIEKSKWYISGYEYNDYDIKLLTKYLKKKSKKSSTSSQESTELSESASASTTYSKEEKELFEEDVDSQTVEIGDIDIDLDIDLDDLKF